MSWNRLYHRIYAIDALRQSAARHQNERKARKKKKNLDEIKRMFGKALTLLPLLSLQSAPGGGRAGLSNDTSDVRPESVFPKINDEDQDLSKQDEAASNLRLVGAEGGGDGGGGEDEDDNEWGFTAKQMSDLQESYNVFDTNRSETIDSSKLFNVMRSLGLNPTEAEVQDLINAVDEDGNGTIEFEEFCEMMQKKIRQSDREDELKDVFRVFDRDEDGEVSVDDMVSLFNALGMEFTLDEVKEMVLAADNVGNFKVNYEDFVKIAKSEPVIELD